MKDSSRFWDNIAERYAKRPVSDQAAYQKKLEVSRGYFKPDMELLEFGCGTGSTALLHAPYVRHIDAIDISVNMLDIARTKARAQGIGNVSFQQSSINAFNANSKAYDIVLAMSILHLLDNWQEIIAKVNAMMKPGGLFITSTTCLGSGMGWFSMVGPALARLGLIPPVQVFTRPELEQTLNDKGFSIEYSWQPRGRLKAVFIVARKTA